MRSANEISGLVLKAARGAGMSLGCAEELARAAPVLAGKGRLARIVDLLLLPFEPPEYLDGSVFGGHPVLAVIAWRDLKAAGIEVKLECDIQPDVFEAFGVQEPVCGPFEVAADVWEQLTVFAAKMLVPESEASRLSGAGAGLTDND